MWTNERIGKVKPSETLAVKSRAAELKAAGKSIIDLSAGEPDIDTPSHIKEAAIKALNAGQTKYTNVTGIPELRKAISEKLKTENGISAEPNDIIVTNGGKQAIYSFFDVILEKGDEVVVLAPYWVSYVPIVEMCGGTPVVVSGLQANGLKVTPEQLKASITDKTKCVVVNSPSNPCGVAYSKAELQALGNVIADKARVLVLSDEVYEKVVFKGFEFCSFAKACSNLAARTITVNAFSKTYSMTGWRIGYAHGPREIIAAMGRHQSQTTSNITSFAQYGAVAALSGSHDFLMSMVANFERRISMVLDMLKEAPGLSVNYKPQGAFYLFISFAGLEKSGKNLPFKGSAELATYLLDNAGVAVVPGEAFGDNSAFRISVSSADDNVKEGVRRIVEAISKLS
jgi:aspartate aminotransferase